MSNEGEPSCQRQNSLFNVERVSDVDSSDIEHFWDDHQVCIELARGAHGFGLTLEGGADRPLFDEDDGVFITNIKEGSNAANLPCLEIGDKILEVNGQNLEKMIHKNVVELFKNSGEKVRLVIHKNIGHILGASQLSKSDREDGLDSPTLDSRELKGFSPVGFVIGIAFGCIAVFAARRYLTQR